MIQAGYRLSRQFEKLVVRQPAQSVTNPVNLPLFF